MSARILIIEDNPANLELMRYLLEAYGHAPLRASDGEEGLAVAQREVPELIICDIQLPGLDGYEAARRLKKDARLRVIPLVAVTAYAMAGDRDKLLKAGFDGYLSKPIAPETFVAQIEAFLPPGRRSVPPSPSSEVAAPSPGPPPMSREKKGSILVVDNSPANLSLLCCLLEPSGYDVVTARSAPEALAIALRIAPDLILSDLHMPGGDGLALIEAVATDARLGTVPFIILSSTAWHEEDRRKAITLGACRFLVRPIEPEALLAEIATCLRDRKGKRPWRPF